MGTTASKMTKAQLAEEVGPWIYAAQTDRDKAVRQVNRFYTKAQLVALYIKKEA